jgi:hypothetical protein
MSYAMCAGAGEQQVIVIGDWRLAIGDRLNANAKRSTPKS